MKQRFVRGPQTSLIAVASSLAFFCFACAKPNYPSQAPSIQSEKVNGLSCDAKFSLSGRCVQISWIERATETSPGSFLFKVTRENLADHSPVPVDTSPAPTVVLWMPSMGHGSSPVTVERADTGTYRASDVFFIMPGEWQIKIQVKNGDLVNDEAIVNITI